MMMALKSRAAAATVASSMLAITSVHAQEAPQSQRVPSSIEDGGLEDIIVTANKRSESLQNVPIAVTAIGGETLRDAQITDISEIAARTPSFTFQQQNLLEQELFIRGIGTVRLNSATADPSIGLFLDEVYIGRRGTATPPVFDLDRVEVLRGPQGTLFGKNVVGGAVSFISARPRREFEAFGSIAAGNYGTVTTQGYVTGALSDDVSARASFYQNRHDGFARNIVTGQELEDLESYAGRLSFRYEPTQDFSVLLVADASRDDSGGPARHAVDDPTQVAPGFITRKLVSADPRTTEAPYTQYADRDTRGVTLRADLTKSFGTITYLAAIRYGKAATRWSQAGAGSPPSITDSVLTQNERYTGITQELRIASPDDRKFGWLVGLYYLREETDRTQQNTAKSFLPGGAGSTRDSLDGDNIYIQNGVSSNYAAFAELKYEIADDLSISLGARYTIDQKKFDSNAIALSLGPPNLPNIYSTAPLQTPYHITVGETWKRLTPRLLLQWSPASEINTYASITRGFKGGGWQGSAADAATAVIAYNPETAWNYEIGVKSDLFDRRVRLNLAAFYTDFKDLQVEQLDAINLTLVVANAASATIKGLEAELQIKPVEGLLLSASGSLLDAKYGQYVDPLQGRNFTGNYLQRTPKRQFTVSGNYDLPIGQVNKLSFNASYLYQARIFWGPENTNREPGYGVVDARINFGSNDGDWQIGVFAKNLTRKLYRTNIIPFLGDEVSLFSAPRTYGVRASKRF